MFKKIFLFILLLISPVFAQAQNADILYYGNGCPHCQKVEQFIEEHKLQDKIIQKEVYHNPQNAEEFNEICEKKGISLMKRGVPFLYTKEECYVGDKQIISYLENKNQIKKETKTKKELNKMSLLVLAGAALTDAINPCAFAVLLILMSTLLAKNKRKSALFAGFSFSFAIFISYFLMGLGLYSIISSFTLSKIFTKIIAVFAIILGLFNLKDYFWYGKFFVTEVPMSWRPKLKSIIKSVTNPIGAFLIGFLVSLFLLPCTSGPYIVIIGMLGQKTLYNKAVLLLLLYNFIFILPMLLITVATYFGLNLERAEKLRTKKINLLHLIAGIIMLLMGVYLLFE